MRKQRVFAPNGREVTTDDLSTVGELAGSVSDQFVSELFRLQSNQGTVARAVIPYGTFKTDGTNPQSAGIVTTSGAADNTLFIYPFRAIIGILGVSSGPELAWTQQRTRPVVFESGSTLQTGVTLDPTASKKRIDLVYCKITILGTQTSDTRYVRDPTTGVVSVQSLIIELSDAFTVGVVKGAETSGTPSRPAIPADTATDFYIPLAYVYLPTTFVASTQIDNHWIHEVVPVIPLARTTSAMTMRPANVQYTTSGALITNQPFDNGGGDERPQAYMPPTMTGGETIMLALDFDAGTPYPPLNAITVVDDSVDWRNRVFRWQSAEKHNIGVTVFAWGSGNCPGVGSFLENGVGQSFFDDGTAFMSTAGGVIAALGTLGGSPMASTVYLFVDLSTGALKAKVSNVSPAARVFVWIDASGQYANA